MVDSDPIGTVPSSAYPFNIGGGGIADPNGNWFNGRLDDVRLYDRALSATEITLLSKIYR
jgi:hypothetical protein